jgi:hypothetical protein
MYRLCVDCCSEWFDTEDEYELMCDDCLARAKEKTEIPVIITGCGEGRWRWSSSKEAQWITESGKCGDRTCLSPDLFECLTRRYGRHTILSVESYRPEETDTGVNEHKGDES